jgi:hypothetical protein
MDWWSVTLFLDDDDRIRAWRCGWERRDPLR